jgi:hypothetical protein
MGRSQSRWTDSKYGNGRTHLRIQPDGQLLVRLRGVVPDQKRRHTTSVNAGEPQSDHVRASAFDTTRPSYKNDDTRVRGREGGSTRRLIHDKNRR